MHDITESFAPVAEYMEPLKPYSELEHDGIEDDACMFCRSDDEIRFAGNADDFAREYRRRLTMLNVRVRSDYPAIQRKLQMTTRRLDALEGIIPKIHMQEREIQDVARDVRALRRTVVELQKLVERPQHTIWDRFVSAVRQIVPSES